jgi:hypothetical protein
LKDIKLLCKGVMIDKITEPQEWIDSLITEFAPNSHDVDVALQNMGLKIKQMQEALDFYRFEAEAIAKNLGSNDEAIIASLHVLSLDAGKRAKK